MVIKNKKGAEFSIGILLVIVVGGIAAVLLILGFSGSLDQVFGKLGLLPNDLTSAVGACKLWIGGDITKNSFCEYKSLRLEGVKQWADCVGVYKVAIKTLQEPEIGYNPALVACTLDSDMYKCLDLMKSTSSKPTILVNGASCTSILQTNEKECASLETNTVERDKCLVGEKTVTAWLPIAGSVVAVEGGAAETGVKKVCCLLPTTAKPPA